MSVIDLAIARLQTLALACTLSSTDATIMLKAAPEKPAEDATVLPIAIAHIGPGEGTAANATALKFMPTVYVDVHFSRVSMRYTYGLIDEFVVQYMKRLAGDPTLNGTVDTIVFPVSWSLGAAEWDKVITQMVRFSIPLKTLETPI